MFGALSDPGRTIGLLVGTMLLVGPMIGLAGPAGAHEVDPCSLHSISAVAGPDRGEIQVRLELPSNGTTIETIEVQRDGTQVAELTLADLMDSVLETGSVDVGGTIDDGVVQTVALERSFEDPVVVAYPATRNGDESVDVRVRNVQSDSFEVFLEEPDDGPHLTETVNYIVAPEGVHETLNGSLDIKAGTVTTDQVHRSPDPFVGERVQFEEGFSSTPAVLATLNSYANGAFMSSTVFDVNATGFDVTQEAGQAGTPAATETIGWIAVSTGAGDGFGFSYDVGVVPEDGDKDGVDDSPEQIAYTFPSTPTLVVDGATGNGVDGFWARGAGLYGAGGASVFAEEDQAVDAERGHASEAFSFVALASPDGQVPLNDPEGPAPYTGNWIDSGLGDNETHEYSLSLDCTNKETGVIGNVSATTFGPPEAPVDLRVNNLAEETNMGEVCGPSFDEQAEIKLVWLGPPDQRGVSVDEFVVFRGNSTQNLTEIGRFEAGTVTSRNGSTQDDAFFYDCEIGDGNTSVYGVAAVNEIGMGPLTIADPIQVVDAPSAPSSVSADSGDLLAGEGITVSWSAPADDGGADLASYAVLRGTDPGDLRPIAAVDGSTTSYVDHDVDPLHTYHYAVLAYNGYLVGDTSATDCARAGPTAIPGLGDCTGL